MFTEERHTRFVQKKMIYRLPTEANWNTHAVLVIKGVCGLGDGKTLSGLIANLDGGKNEYIIGLIVL